MRGRASGLFIGFADIVTGRYGLCHNEAVQDTLRSNTPQRVHYFYKGVAIFFLNGVAIVHFYSETHKPRPSGVAARSSGPLVL